MESYLNAVFEWISQRSGTVTGDAYRECGGHLDLSVTYILQQLESTPKKQTAISH